MLGDPASILRTMGNDSVDAVFVDTSSSSLDFSPALEAALSVCEEVALYLNGSDDAADVFVLAMAIGESGSGSGVELERQVLEDGEESGVIVYYGELASNPELAKAKKKSLTRAVVNC